MQPYTGELKRIADGDKIPDGFLEVPDKLESDAQKVISEALNIGVKEFHSRPMVVTGKTQAGQNLKAWARNERNKAKRKRNMAKKSKKKNR